ncbi:MAG TPA: SRPBCC family protein [Vicinamibacterales bacterium]
MATVTVSNVIAAPIDRVFQLFTDIEHGPAHVSDIKRIEMLTPGPVRRGTRWRETRSLIGGVQDSAEMEITSFERNRTYTITHHKAGVQLDTSFWFETVDAGTNVSVEFELEPGGVPPGLLAPLGWAIEGKVKQVLSRDLADLKHAIEG